MGGAPKVAWEPKEPKNGFEKFVGPGATRAELLLQFVPAFLAPVLVIWHALSSGVGWGIAHYIVAALLAVDMVGGVLTNATAAAKRWYHREGQGFRQHYGFVMIHALQLGLVAFLFRDLDWLFFVVFYTYLLVTAALLLRAPLYLQRPLALLLLLIAIALDQYGFSPTPGFEWFVPVFFLKLLVSHLLKEAPYEPRAQPEGR